MFLVWLVFVLLEPVRSAEPPMVSGTAPLMTSSAISEDLRVATFGLSADSFFFEVAGNLYGSTLLGGGANFNCNIGGQRPTGCGTVFKLSPQSDGSWSESI